MRPLNRDLTAYQPETIAEPTQAQCTRTGAILMPKESTMQETRDGDRLEAHTPTKEQYAAEEVRKALTEDAKRRARGVPDCECGAQMDLGSYSPDGSGCDWICWRCIDAGNPPGIAAAITVSEEQIEAAAKAHHAEEDTDDTTPWEFEVFADDYRRCTRAAFRAAGFEVTP